MARRNGAEASTPQSSSKSSEPAPTRCGTRARATKNHTYVLDTSVLLADPAAFLRFAEDDVVLPLIVISELEAKRNHPELGYFARAALRRLHALRLEHGRLDKPLSVNDAGGTLRVELNHADQSVLPPGFRTDGNDT